MGEERMGSTEDERPPVLGDASFYEEILDVINDCIKIVSRDRTIRFVNQAAADLLARSKQELEGLKCHREFNGCPGPCDFCRVDEVFRTGRAKRFAVWIERGGGERYMEFSVLPMKDRSDSVNWVVEITRDLTEKRKIEDRIAFQEKLGLLGEISTRIADQMKNPISAILTASRVFAESRDRLSSHERETLSRVLHEEGARIQSLLHDFLSAGARRAPVRVFLDPAAVTDEVLRAMQQGPSCPAGIRWKTGPVLKGGRIFADAEQIKQVLWNVLLNAVEAVDGKGEISVQVERDGEFIRWSVVDTGKGIDPKHLTQVFEPFWSRKKGARGLGLTVAKYLLDMHDGEIDVKNRPGGGAWVAVRLPAGK
ncbi:MAG: ATP-binding protein [bacterium]